MISEQNLDFWIKNGYNVLFKGKHGVGKTSIILEAFKKHNLSWQYFSAATMDPWVDFVGVPKERTTNDGKSYLDLVRPKHFQDDSVEAIFMDEFNRASKKVRNAVMELIQFKSINGKRFNNLKIIWAAVNPDDDEDEEYDVEKLDAAQLDRFQVHVDVPYAPVAAYFRSKYGESVSHTAIGWWKALSKDEKSLVSPRRLDYAIDVYLKNGDIRNVLPKNVSISKLLQELRGGPYIDKLNAAVAAKDEAAAKKLANDENALSAIVPALTKSHDAMALVLPHVNRERLAGLMTDNKGIAEHVLAYPKPFKDLLMQLANSNNALAYRAGSALRFNGLTANAKPRFTPKPDATAHKLRKELESHVFLLHTSPDRKKAYETLVNNVTPSLSENVAYDVMNVIDGIIRQSQRKTIEQSMPLLLPMIEHVLALRPKAVMDTLTDSSLVRITDIDPAMGGQLRVKMGGSNANRPSPTFDDVDDDCDDDDDGYGF